MICNQKILSGDKLLLMAQKEKKSIQMLSDYISYLSLMSIQRANSGHPGLPLGCSLAMTVLYCYFLRYADAKDMKKRSAFFRDRFILSAGHGSALLYALQSVFGSFFSVKDLSKFRSLHSHTPGHPEYDLQRGIETTTGPLGQGFANAVGMAIAGKMMAARLGKCLNTSQNLIDYRIFTLMGDGCMMEGVTQEAASLAGHLGLDNFIAIYDSNKISIDGQTDITFSENVGLRFESMGYEVFQCNGHNFLDIVETMDQILCEKNIEKGRQKPKLLILETTIGKGLLGVEGSEKAHGVPAGVEKIVHFIENSSLITLEMWKNFVDADARSKQDFLQKQLEKGSFFVWEQVKKEIEEKNSTVFVDWSSTEYFVKKQENLDEILSDPLLQNSATKNFFEQCENSEPSDILVEKLKKYRYSKEKGASRAISGEVLQCIAKEMPHFVGGSADLVSSTKASIENSDYINKNDFSGNNIAYGVREHAMAAIGNGLALSFPFVPFSSTFFTFLDYLRPSLRLSALMELKHLYIFTHDSFAVGEDGPTHQPVEHLNSLRLVPGINVFRPGNDAEVAWSYLHFLSYQMPAALILSRQSFFDEVFVKKDNFYEDFVKGAYIYSKEKKDNLDLVIVASGYELGIALKAQEMMKKSNKFIRVVSMPSPNFFMQQGKDYIGHVLGFLSNAGLVYLESGSFGPFCFKERPDGRTWIKSLEHFGFSGSQEDLEKHLSYDVEGFVLELTKKFF